MLFRSETTEEELGEMTKTNNPEEIDIDEDGSTDEDEQVEGLDISRDSHNDLIFLIIWTERLRTQNCVSFSVIVLCPVFIASQTNSDMLFILELFSSDWQPQPVHLGLSVCVIFNGVGANVCDLAWYCLIRPRNVDWVWSCGAWVNYGYSCAVWTRRLVSKSMSVADCSWCHGWRLSANKGLKLSAKVGLKLWFLPVFIGFRQIVWKICGLFK